jgi:hypothetical protein
MQKKCSIIIPTNEEDAVIQAGINADPDAFEITEEMRADPHFHYVDHRKIKSGKPKLVKSDKLESHAPEFINDKV